MTSYNLLCFALVLSGVIFLFVYPLAILWPSGWAWHAGARYESEYFMMIVGVYATLGLFLINAARAPLENRSLIWFTIASSVVHVPALLLVAIVLSILISVSGRCSNSART